MPTPVITKADDIKVMPGISALIYAAAGIGKTTLLGTLPGRTLVIDIESGTRVLIGKKNIDIIHVPQDLTGLKETFDWLRSAEAKAYQFVCLDSATELEKYMLIRLADRAGKNTIPSLKDYGEAQHKMREYLRTIRDLTVNGQHVIINALEMQSDATDGTTQKSRLMPMMMNKLAPEICGLTDIVGRMEISSREESAGERFIRLEATEIITAKDRAFGRKYCKATGTDLFQIKEGK